MTRLIVTSDLHYDTDGDLTPPDEVKRVADEIAALAPDLLVLAGDLGHRLDEFRACLRCFEGVCATTGVVAGNHDVWRDDRAGHGSQALFERLLPAATADAGFTWLEGAVLRAGDRAVAGSMAWYDYSAVDPRLRGRYSDAEMARLKGNMNNDAGWIDWPWTDVEVAAQLRRELLAQLDALAADPGVEAVAVVTHVPLLEAQMIRKPDDDRWGLSNAFFGNLTTGDGVLARDKVRAVVSGHTHGAVEARVGEVDARVVGSDYGEAAFVVVEL